MVHPELIRLIGNFIDRVINQDDPVLQGFTVRMVDVYVFVVVNDTILQYKLTDFPSFCYVPWKEVSE